MKPLPRLLPLVAVAIGGVLAVKALSDVQAVPDLFARAQAEETPASGHPAKTPAAPPTPPVTPVAAAPPRPTPACAQSPAEIAREAGLSPGELQTLQNLGTRRGQLDDRERALDTQVQLLAAAEAKVDAKIGAMNAVRDQIKGLLGQADQQQQADVDRLTLVYQKMKPADAAAIMATLDDKVRIPVAAKMKDAALAQILAKMPTEEAKKLTESLARRAASAREAMAAAEQGPAAVDDTHATSPDPTAPPPAPKIKPRARPRKLAARRPTPHAAAAAVTATPLPAAMSAKAAMAKPAPSTTAPAATAG